MPAFHSISCPEEDWSLYVCFRENTMVLPAARARGFQRMPLAPTPSCSIGKAVGVRWRSPLDLRELGRLNGKRNVNSAWPLDGGYPMIGLLSSFNALALTTDSSDLMRRVSLSSSHRLRA